MKPGVKRQRKGPVITTTLRPVLNSCWIPIKYGPWAGTVQRMNILSLVPTQTQPSTRNS